MGIVQNMYAHFSQVAHKYRQVRTTDSEPIEYIAEILKGLPEVKAADVGCGDGRYDLLLFQHIEYLHLICIDINESMLKQASDCLTSHKITNFGMIKAVADMIPLKDDSMDFILTFNAIHHFDFAKFIEQSCKGIKKGGKLFIYTRLKSQNERNIWGQSFPLFSEKETRLYELDVIKQWIQSVDALQLEETKPFNYKRNATLEQLIERVKAKHYSTFSLYDEDELHEALKGFQENIKRHCRDTNRIEWIDENLLLILKKRTFGDVAD